MASWSHLVRRFAGSLWPGGPAPAAESWARSCLLPGEVSLWERMSGPDRRHAVGVAHRTRGALGERAERQVLAAALLHDVGKVDSALGPVRRAGATLIAGAAGYERARGWAEGGGSRGRVGRYLCHDRIGADLLSAAGSHGLTVAWAREHHLPEARWSVPRTIGAALKAADDD